MFFHLELNMFTEVIPLFKDDKWYLIYESLFLILLLTPDV